MPSPTASRSPISQLSASQPRVPPTSSQAQVRSSGEAEDPLLGALLRDLGPALRRGATPPPPSPRCPTGLPAIDRLLGGGFPRDRLSEIVGPASCGRTSLALALLASTTHSGEVVAVVDGSDAFDPASAAAAGVDLARVLWVRAPGVRQALRSTEHLLDARGFALVILDLTCNANPSQPEPGSRKGMQTRPQTGTRTGTQTGTRKGVQKMSRDTATSATSVWLRMRGKAAGANTALVVLGDRRKVGSSADLAIEMSPLRARFSGAPSLLEGLEGDLLLVRNRLGPPDRSAAVHWPAQWPKPRRRREPRAGVS